MSRLDALPWIDLGHGVEACEFRYEPEGQLHIAYRHNCTQGNATPRRAFAAIPVSEAGGGRDWKLESRDPLTVSPSLLCGCGHHGFIRDGKWIPA